MKKQILFITLTLCVGISISAHQAKLTPQEAAKKNEDCRFLHIPKEVQAHIISYLQKLKNRSHVAFTCKDLKAGFDYFIKTWEKQNIKVSNRLLQKALRFPLKIFKKIIAQTETIDFFDYKRSFNKAIFFHFKAFASNKTVPGLQEKTEILLKKINFKDIEKFITNIKRIIKIIKERKKITYNKLVLALEKLIISYSLSFNIASRSFFETRKQRTQYYKKLENILTSLKKDLEEELEKRTEEKKINQDFDDAIEDNNTLLIKQLIQNKKLLKSSIIMASRIYAGEGNLEITKIMINELERRSDADDNSFICYPIHLSIQNNKHNVTEFLAKKLTLQSWALSDAISWAERQNKQDIFQDLKEQHAQQIFRIVKEF